MLDCHPPVGKVAAHLTASARPPEAEIVDHFNRSTVAPNRSSTIRFEHSRKAVRAADEPEP